MFLDELLPFNFSNELNERFNIFTDHYILYDSKKIFELNLQNKFKRAILNFLIDKNFNSKINIEVYADSDLVASFVSMYDKKFTLNCDLNYCEKLTIKSEGDLFEAIIYDSILLESSPEYSLILLDKTPHIKQQIYEDNVIIISLDKKNKKYLSTCLNFLKEFSNINYKIFIVCGEFFSDIEELCESFSAQIIILPSQSINILKCNIINFIKAKKYLFLNPRTLIVDDLSDLVNRIHSLNKKFLIAREQGVSKFQKFGEFIDGTFPFPYAGFQEDVNTLQVDSEIYNSAEIYNCEIFACDYFSLLSFSSYIKNNEYQIKKYLDNQDENEYRFGAVLNNFLIRSDMAEEMPAKYNVQLYHDDCVIQVDEKLTFLYKNKKASILHFNGLQSEYKYNKLKNYALDFFKSEPKLLQKNYNSIDINAEFLYQSSIEAENCPKIFDKCIFTFAKKGQESLLKTWLWSIQNHLNYDICILNINSDEVISAIAKEFGCNEIKVKDVSKTQAYKNLIFCVQKFIYSNIYLFIDLSCVLLENISKEIDKYVDLETNKIFIAGENYEEEKIYNLKSELYRIFKEDPTEKTNEFELEEKILLSSNILNCNFFIANKTTLNNIYEEISSYNESFKYWSLSYVNAHKFIFNYAILKLDNFEELDISYNFVVQNHDRIQIWREKNLPKARFKNKKIKLLNFDGGSKYLHKYLTIYPTYIHEEQSEWLNYLKSLNLFLKISGSDNLMPYFYPKSNKNFPNYQLDLDKFINFVKNLVTIRGPKKVIEAGCGHGLFTAALASILPEGSEIYCIEEPKSISNLPFFWYLDLKTQSKIKFILDYPEYSFRKLIDNNEKFDMIFINGNHEMEECYALSLIGRNLLNDNDPLVIHAPGKDYSDINFISSRLIEKGFSVSNIVSKYPGEDTINYMISTRNIDLNVKPKISVMCYLKSHNQTFNFINSIKNSSYPKNKLQIIILFDKENQIIKHHLNEIECASLDFIEFDQENSLAWHEGLKYYLKHHMNHGMIVWRANLLTDNNFIESLVTQNCPVSQCIVCNDSAQVKASHLIKHLNTAIHILPSELSNYYFVDWVENSPIFATRSKWLALYKNDGFKYCNLESNVGLEGWLYKTLRAKSYLIKNSGAWVINDKNIGYKAIMINGNIKIYQKYIPV